jgi:hypothetical protein
VANFTSRTLYPPVPTVQDANLDTVEKNPDPRRESNQIPWSLSLYMGFEVLTAVDIWVITPCSPLQAIDISVEHVAFTFAVEQQTAFHCSVLSAGFLLGLLFNPEDEDGTFLRNVWSTFQRVIRRCISKIYNSI